MIESLLKFKTDKNLELHLKLIDFYNNILTKESVFRAAVIVGSFAKGNPDRVSDIDLVSFVGDGLGEKALEHFKKNEPFSVINSYSGKHGDDLVYKKTIFDNFLSSEVHIAERKSTFRLKKPFVVLFDHDDLLKNIAVEGEPPKHKDFPTLSSGGDEMGWALFDLLKWWSRGEKDLTKMHILKIAEELRKNASNTSP